MTSEEIIRHLNSRRPQFLTDMHCEITDVDPQSGNCKMGFEITERYCHSGTIIQGGFVTAMLDAVTSHAAFAANPKARAVSTLEVKVTFYEASRMGKLHAVGRVDKMTRNFAFLSGDLFDEAGVRTASITATAKISSENHPE